MPNKDLLFYAGYIVLAVWIFGPRLVRFIKAKIESRPLIPPAVIAPKPAEDPEVTAEKVTAAVLEALRPTLDISNHSEPDLLKAVLEESKRQTMILIDVADYQFQVMVLQKKLLKGILGGENYTEMNDERASEIEAIQDLMDRKGFSRETATQHVRARNTYSREGKTYSREGLGIGR